MGGLDEEVALRATRRWLRRTEVAGLSAVGADAVEGDFMVFELGLAVAVRPRQGREGAGFVKPPQVAGDVGYGRQRGFVGFLGDGDGVCVSHELLLAAI